jgi:hypothetical protein
VPPDIRPAAVASIDPIDGAIEQLRRVLRDLAYGQITITVHDGAIVQIDRTEKLRLDRGSRRRDP